MSTGVVSLDLLKDKIQAREIDTVILACTDLYGRLVGKRFDADFFLSSGAKDGTHACDYLFTADMEMEPIAGYTFANWEKGYGDVHLQPDFATLRILSWLDKTAFVMCDVYQVEQHVLVDIAPRSILLKQIEHLATLGYQAKGASELEYYLFDTSYQQAHETDYQKLPPKGWYLEDYHLLHGTRNESFHGAARKHLRDSGIPVENSKGEWGLGQHELNIKYTDLLEMSDRHGLYKQCLKELAEQQHCAVTFMAKYHHDHAGSSCHIHISLWQDDSNAFADAKVGDAQYNDLFRWFLGGWIRYAPDLMVFYAPTVNSYKRYQAGSWAPTKLAWSRDNRTAGFRIVGTGQSLRIECRIPGADCNPYLIYAAALSSGIAGIQHKIEPPDIFQGDIYQAEHLPEVPPTLTDAIQKFKTSDWVKQTFGEAVVSHYTHFYETEQAAYNQTVTDWERRRYFERI